MELIDYQFEISPKKIKDYLLNEIHPKGKTKAKWFLGKGFDFENLNLSLVQHGKFGKIQKEEKTPFGIFLTIEGILFLRNEPMRNFRSVWEFLNNEKKCRFVTAYPI
jgi:hypothetical protein